MENELILRLVAFWGVFIIIALCESMFPKRNLRVEKNIRWVRNISLIMIGNIISRLVIPFSAASVSIYSEYNQIGLFYLVPIPFFVIVLISIIILDLVIYAQHVIFHHVPLLWRLHKIHHIDQDIDVTTGIRFHPVEIILSALIKSITVLLLGIPLIAIVLFEILLNATSMFNHGNIKLPKKFDEFLRHIIVTPDMHRVHHSVTVKETNSNFGFNLSCWDRLFKTYKAQPELGHIKMEIGLNQYQNPEKTGLLKILTLPFHKDQ